MLKLSQVIHPLEQYYLEEMMDTVAFQDEIKTYYVSYTEKLKVPDLLGKTVQVTPYQFVEVYEIIVQICKQLELEVPNVYVYEDFYYGAESYGIDNPWIEISAKTIRDFTKGELTFLLAKELGAIKLGHTYYKMLIQETLKVIETKGYLPGADITYETWRAISYRWMRTAYYTTDAVGYSLCGSITDAVACILKTILNSDELAKQINIKEYMKQGNNITKLQDLVSNQTKLDESVPYGPYRIKYLIGFAGANI